MLFCFSVVNEELIQTSQLEWFITNVLDNRTSLSSPVISFVVCLVGWLGETERSFVRFRKTIEKYLSTVGEDVRFLQDFSVAASVYESLSKICSHVVGLTSVLNDSGGN